MWLLDFIEWNLFFVGSSWAFYLSVKHSWLASTVHTCVIHVHAGIWHFRTDQILIFIDVLFSILDGFRIFGTRTNMSEIRVYRTNLSVVLFFLNPLESIPNLTLSVFKYQEICFKVFIVYKNVFLFNLILRVAFHHQTWIKIFDVLCSYLKVNKH